MRRSCAGPALRRRPSPSGARRRRAPRRRGRRARASERAEPRAPRTRWPAASSELQAARGRASARQRWPRVPVQGPRVVRRRRRGRLLRPRAARRRAGRAAGGRAAHGRRRRRRAAASPRRCAPACWRRWPAGVLPGSSAGRSRCCGPGDHPLRALEQATAEARRRAALVVAVDQFEELFTACRDERERAAVRRRARRAARDPRRQRGRARGGPRRLLRPLRRLPGAVAPDGRQPRAGRADAPRRAAPRDRAAGAPAPGCDVEPELTDALVADVEDEPGALPLLSSSLLELWQRRDGQRAAVRRLRGRRRRARRGGAAGRARLRAARRPEQREVARRILLRLVTEGEGDEVVRRRAAPLSWVEGDEVWKTLGVLADSASSRSARARSRSRTRRSCASGRACAAGSRRTRGTPAAPPPDRRRRATGRPPAASRASSIAAPGSPRRSTGPATHGASSTRRSATSSSTAARRGARRAAPAPGEPPAAHCSSAGSLRCSRSPSSPASSR